MHPLVTPVDINGIWHVSLFVSLAISFFFFASRFPSPVCWLWTYVIGQALYVVEFPSLRYGDLTRAFQASAGQTLAEALLFPLVAIFARDAVKKVIPALLISEIILVWMRHSGLFIAESFDTAFIALCIPFVDWRLGLLGVFTVLTRHGGTAQMILAAEVLGWALATQRGKNLGILLGVLIAGLLLFLRIHSHGTPFMDGWERIQIYRDMMKFWIQAPIFIALGTGAGSFMWTSLLIHQFKDPMWLAMHSDWLQLTFEYGLVGLALALWAVSAALWKTRRRPRLLAAVLGASAFALTYHPLRFPASALLVALIFTEALDVKRPEAFMPRAF